MQNKTFTSEEETFEFYENRYNQGYMEEWDPEKKKKVFELIRGLNLPKKGKALDFGCGNGILTEIIKISLPQWEVHGCDVSDIAVTNASKKLPHLNFFFHDGGPKFSQYFDFIFTHHVFEHVYDVKKSWTELARYGNDSSIIINILPCGNKNSFEYNYCLLFKDGIDKSRGNRFFFEDPGHLRRMTTRDMEEEAKENNYYLFKSYYAHQYYGALNWITKSGDAFIEEFTATTDAIDEFSKREILKIKRKLLSLSRSYAHSKRPIKNEIKLFFKKGSLKVFLSIWSVFYGRCVTSYYKKRASLEWQYSKNKRNGSEMFLLFKRISNHL